MAYYTKNLKEGSTVPVMHYLLHDGGYLSSSDFQLLLLIISMLLKQSTIITKLRLLVAIVSKLNRERIGSEVAAPIRVRRR